MSQVFRIPVVGGGDSRASLLTDALPKNDQALQTLFAGPAAPSGGAGPVAYQLWQDTGTTIISVAGTLWHRNAAGTGWNIMRRRLIRFGDVALAARTWRSTPRVVVPSWVESICIVGSTTTVASVATTKEWVWNLKNQTSGLQLFSALPSTATTVGGVGGGELTADVPKVLTANQNQALAAGDELRFIVTVNGAPTAVADIAFVVSLWELTA